MDKGIRTLRNSLFFIIFLLILLVAFGVSIIIDQNRDSVFSKEEVEAIRVFRLMDSISLGY